MQLIVFFLRKIYALFIVFGCLGVELFAEKASVLERACTPVEAKGASSSFIGVDQRLNALITRIVTALKDGDKKTLETFFHKKLQQNGIDLDDLFSRLHLIYRPPYKFSVARLWELKTAEAVDKLFCAKDALYLKPLYGYAQQYYLWLSVIGKKEMGRIVVALVAPKSKWTIGALHIQQWTHQGLDFNDWLVKAEAKKKKKKMLSYAMFDIAIKLLQDNPFMHFPQKQNIRRVQQGVMVTSEWKEKIRSVAKKWHIIFINSVLTQNGVGVLLRVQIPKVLSGKEINGLCRSMLDSFKTHSWFADFSGIKCSFVVKGEDPSKEGVLGGIYLPVK